jgi:hypothetical protein
MEVIPRALPPDPDRERKQVTQKRSCVDLKRGVMGKAPALIGVAQKQTAAAARERSAGRHLASTFIHRSFVALHSPSPH